LFNLKSSDNTIRAICMKYENTFLENLKFDGEGFSLESAVESGAFNVRVHYEDRNVYLRCQYSLSNNFGCLYQLNANISYLNVENYIFKVLEICGKKKVTKKYKRDHPSTFIYLFPEY